MSRASIRDVWFPSRPLVSSCRRPLESPRTRHWYENGVTRPQVCLNATAPALVSPTPQSSFRRKPESRGEGRGECSAGACPQLGAGCVAQTTPDPSINQCTQFSYPGVPATAGMSDWYKSVSRTPIRDGWFPSRPLVSSCRRPLESPRTRHSYENVPSNQPRCRLSPGETCRIVDRWSMAE